VGAVLAVMLVAVGGTLIYLDTAPQPVAPNVAGTKSPASGDSGFNMGVDISGAFSMIHDVFVKTDTVTSTTTQNTTSEKTTTTTVVSSTTKFLTLTQTSVSTLTATSSGYAVPANVTLLFANMDGNYTYDIQAGSSSTSGAVGSNSPYTLQLSGLSQGQTIAITAATAGGGACRTGEHFSLQLWINGQLVAQSDSFCGDGSSSARITYTV
jgi:hypothetical protein